MAADEKRRTDWALILGASSGFGAESARELARAGLNIYGVHLDRRSAMSRIDELVAELQGFGVSVIFHNMSATDPIKRADVVEELKSHGSIRIKVLLHSLAFGGLKPVIGDDTGTALTQKQVEMTVDVMGNSVVYWAQDLYGAGLLKKGSQIFTMTSAGGRRQWETYGAVSAAKAVLESFTRQLAYEFSSRQIAANALQAGVTDTPALRKIPGHEEMIEYARSRNPGKRLTIPQDVAKIVKLIGLSEDTWLTGNTIRVDGGEDITG